MSGGKGIPKTKWSEEEERALKVGVERYGAGKWRKIQKDEELCKILQSRSNVDLKDKWRNLSVFSGGITAATVAAVSNSKEAAGSSKKAPAKSAEPAADTTKEITKSKLEGLIMEAMVSSKEQSGSNVTSIAKYVETHLEAGTAVPQNFRGKVLGDTLTALVSKGKLIKARMLFKLPIPAEKPTSKSAPKSKEKEAKVVEAAPAQGETGGGGGVGSTQTRKAARSTRGGGAAATAVKPEPSAAAAAAAAAATPPPKTRRGAVATPTPVADTDNDAEKNELIEIRSQIKVHKAKLAAMKGNPSALKAAKVALDAAMSAVLDVETCREQAEAAGKQGKPTKPKPKPSKQLPLRTRLRKRS